MKKNLLTLICLLLTISIAAQEVNRNLNLKDLRSRLSTRKIPHDLTRPSIMKSIKGDMKYKNDSTFLLNFSSLTDSVFQEKLYYRYNSKGNLYFKSDHEYIWDYQIKQHFIYDEQGNQTTTQFEKQNASWTNNKWARAGKNDWDYDTSGNKIVDINYQWDPATGQWRNNAKTENAYDNKGNQTLSIDYQWNIPNEEWEITGKSEWYYQEEKTHSILSYSWYQFEENWRPLPLPEQDYDTLLLIYTWDKNKSDYVNSVKERRKFDDQGYMILNERHQWADTANRWLPIVREEFMHGPAGQDTLYRGYLWDDTKKAWNLSWADTITWDWNGRWSELKYTVGDTADYTKLHVEEWYVREFDTIKNVDMIKVYSAPVTDQKTYTEMYWVYDTHGNLILYDWLDIQNEMLIKRYKQNNYWSIPDTLKAKDASLWDVTINGGELRPIVNDVISKSSEIFNDEINRYYVLIDTSKAPPVTWMKNDPNSSIVDSAATDLTSTNQKDRTTTLTVTAEDGSTIKNYSFEFYKMNHLATLDSLRVSEGKLSPDFNPEILEYYDTINGECSIPPVVTFKASSPFAQTIKTTSINCKKKTIITTINLIADDGIANQHYKIYFSFIDDINKIPAKDFVIYPNPVSDILNLEHNNPMKEVTIFNMLGKTVGKYEMNSVTTGAIPLVGLKKGLYFIQMRDVRGQIFMKKVIKE